MVELFLSLLWMPTNISFLIKFFLAHEITLNFRFRTDRISVILLNKWVSTVVYSYNSGLVPESSRQIPKSTAPNDGGFPQLIFKPARRSQRHPTTDPHFIPSRFSIDAGPARVSCTCQLPLLSTGQLDNEFRRSATPKVSLTSNLNDRCSNHLKIANFSFIFSNYDLYLFL